MAIFFSAANYFKNLKLIFKKSAPKQVPHFTETLKSQDPEMKKMIQKWGGHALYEYLCKYCLHEFFLNKEMNS